MTEDWTIWSMGPFWRIGLAGWWPVAWGRAGWLLSWMLSFLVIWFVGWLAGWLVGQCSEVDHVDWPLVILMVDWLSVQGVVVQCQGIGPDDEWILVEELGWLACGWWLEAGLAGF